MLNNIASMLGVGAAAVDYAYESIATVSGNGSSDTVSFTSIPATYTHLQIRILGRVTPATTVENTTLYFNSDTATNYSGHYLYGNGSAAAAGGSANTSGARSMGRIPGASIAANIMGVAIIDVLDYANTNKYKTTRSLTGWDSNGNGEAWFGSGSWRNTAAINRIDIQQVYGSGGWTSSSTFALYGIK